jgi:hypothetical protein
VIYFPFTFDYDTLCVVHAALDEYYIATVGDMPELSKIARNVRDQMFFMLEKVDREIG